MDLRAATSDLSLHRVQGNTLDLPLMDNSAQFRRVVLYVKQSLALMVYQRAPGDGTVQSVPPPATKRTKNETFSCPWNDPAMGRFRGTNIHARDHL